MKVQSLVFGPTTLKVGDILKVTAVIVNDGKAAVTGSNIPPSGYVYKESDDFKTLKFEAVDGAPMLYAHGWPFPLALPWRWGFAGTLAPGGSVTITGGIKMEVAGGFMIDGGVIIIGSGGVGEVKGVSETAITVLSSGGTGGDASAVQAELDALKAYLRSTPQ